VVLWILGFLRLSSTSQPASQAARTQPKGDDPKCMLASMQPSKNNVKITSVFTTVCCVSLMACSIHAWTPKLNN
jgi:hypothetical protein